MRCGLARGCGRAGGWVGANGRAGSEHEAAAHTSWLHAGEGEPCPTHAPGGVHSGVINLGDLLGARIHAPIQRDVLTQLARGGVEPQHQWELACSQSGARGRGGVHAHRWATRAAQHGNLGMSRQHAVTVARAAHLCTTRAMAAPPSPRRPRAQSPQSGRRPWPGAGPWQTTSRRPRPTWSRACRRLAGQGGRESGGGVPKREAASNRRNGHPAAGAESRRGAPAAASRSGGGSGRCV